jgi:hypothetical protein
MNFSCALLFAGRSVPSFPTIKGYSAQLKRAMHISLCKALRTEKLEA